MQGRLSEARHLRLDAVAGPSANLTNFNPKFHDAPHRKADS
ncbi:MAG TPA: hypothetical protein VII25_00610 [Candidatus Acidoferrum sp.]